MYVRKFWFKHQIIVIYAIITLVLFEKVYGTSKSIIDELFHIDQGLTYCYGFYQEWNPKITTLPGLYLLTIFLPRCSIYNLRLISLICSIINFYLILNIKQWINSKTEGSLDVLLDSASLILLPPMYFFALIYYTDIPSITTILLTFNFSIKKKHLLSAICGSMSVLMRQTNIVWVTGIFGARAIETMIAKLYPEKNPSEMTKEDFYNALKFHMQRPRMIVELTFKIITYYYGYILVILGFLLFLYINGSIVVGDKEAHEATIHMPQLFYFSLFTLVFGSSLWLPNMKKAILYARSIRSIMIVTIIGIIMAFIIHYNTIVHPYLLADNRHYTFYIWNRLYNRNLYFKYLMIPIYIFGMLNIILSIEGSIGFKIFFMISTLMTLCLQGLIEIRYFLIPFIILRLQKANIQKKWLLVELAINLIINCLTFKVFFSIETKWPEFQESQRIIW